MRLPAHRTGGAITSSCSPWCAMHLSPSCLRCADLFLGADRAHGVHTSQVGMIFPLVFTLIMRKLRKRPLKPLPGERILLVTAHPDDEAMFFSPFLLSSSSTAQEISLLCLSTGAFPLWPAAPRRPPAPSLVSFTLLLWPAARWQATSTVWGRRGPES